MIKLPKNIIAMEIDFVRFGVLFHVYTEHGGPTIVSSVNNSMYNENGVEIFESCNEVGYVFPDINAALRVEGMNIQRTTDLPTMIQGKRVQLLEKFHKFYTKWRVTQFDGYSVVFSCQNEEDIRIREESGCLGRYFNEDGTFKSAGAHVRFFCAYIGEKLP